MNTQEKLLLDLMRVVSDVRKSRAYLMSYKTEGDTTEDEGMIHVSADEDEISICFKRSFVNIPYCTDSDESDEGLNDWQKQSIISAEWGGPGERFIESKPTYDIISKGYPSLKAYSIVLFNNGVTGIELRKRK